MADGIGPREQRKRMVNPHWGRVDYEQFAVTVLGIAAALSPMSINVLVEGEDLVAGGESE